MTIRREKQARKLTDLWKVVRSVIAAAFGVQSRRRQEEDFAAHTVLPFIVGGLVFTSVFVGVLVMIVQLVTD